MSVQSIEGLHYILHCPTCHCTRHEHFDDVGSACGSTTSSVDITKMRNMLSDDEAFKKENNLTKPITAQK